MALRWPPENVRETTITRRSWLEWTGRAVVLGLGAEPLAACTRAGNLKPEDASAQENPGDVPPGVRADVPTDGLDFSPGDGQHDAYSSWPGRTVDRQALEEILAGWRVRIDGLVEEPLTLSFEELTSLPRQDQVTDLHCVEGWSVHDVPWSGVHLSTLLDRVRPLSSATHPPSTRSGTATTSRCPSTSRSNRTRSSPTAWEARPCRCRTGSRCTSWSRVSTPTRAPSTSSASSSPTAPPRASG